MEAENIPEEKDVRRLSAIIRRAYKFEETESNTSESVKYLCCGKCVRSDRNTPGLWWWEPSSDNSSQLTQYCLDSTVHGLKYTTQPARHFCERLFWLILIAFATVIATWLLVILWKDFCNPRLIVTMDSEVTHISQVPFPSVSICKATGKIEDSSKRQSTSRRKGQELTLLKESTCSSTPRNLFNKASNRNGTDKGSENSTDSLNQFCNELLEECRFNSKSETCESLFRPVSSVVGLCCTFDMKRITTSFSQKLVEKSAEGLLKFQSFVGVNSGLSLVVNVTKPRDSCGEFKTGSLSIVVGHPLSSISSLDETINLETNTQAVIQLVPSISKAEDNVESVDIKERKCYFPGENILTHFKEYTKSNCLVECMMVQVQKTCGCIPPYVDGLQSATGQTCSNSTCVQSMQKEFLDKSMNPECGDCYPLCNDVHYALQRTSTAVALKNNTRVHVYFTSYPIHARVLSAYNPHSIVYYIALSGGILSLCLGCSGLSLVEILYYFTLRSVCNSRRRDTKWGIAGEKLQRTLRKLKLRKERLTQITKVRPAPQIQVQNYMNDDSNELEAVIVET